MPMHFDERSDYRVSDAEEWLNNHPIFKSSDLPIFLCHSPSSSSDDRFWASPLRQGLHAK